jgi:hypothetical protein
MFQRWYPGTRRRFVNRCAEGKEKRKRRSGYGDILLGDGLQDI